MPPLGCVTRSNWNFTMIMLAWLINAIHQKLEHNCKPPPFGIRMNTLLFKSIGQILEFYIFTHNSWQIFTNSPLPFIISVHILSHLGGFLLFNDVIAHSTSDFESPISLSWSSCSMPVLDLLSGSQYIFS